MSTPTPLRSGTALSWAQYDALGEDARTEYIDGYAVVSPSPSLRHQRTAHRLVALLQASLPAGWEATAAWSWRTATDEYIPDVLVHPSAGDAVRFTGTPALVVEILSSNRADDLVLKTNRYAAARLPRYWIVDQREGTLTAYALDDGGLFRPQAHLALTDEAPQRLPVGPVDVDVDLRALLADPATTPGAS